MASLGLTMGRLFQPIVMPAMQCQGPFLWYGLVGLRMLALFIAESTWSSVKQDFICNQTLSDFCRGLCFNHVFAYSTYTLWSAYFLVLLGVVVLLLVLTSKTVRHRDQQRKEGDLILENGNKGAVNTSDPAEASDSISIQGPPWFLPRLAACLLLLCGVEMSFCFLLFVIQSRAFQAATMSCVTHDQQCPAKETHCVLLGRADKLTAIIILGMTSVVNVTFSLGYFMYRCWSAAGCGFKRRR